MGGTQRIPLPNGDPVTEPVDGGASSGQLPVASGRGKEDWRCGNITVQVAAGKGERGGPGSWAGTNESCELMRASGRQAGASWSQFIVPAVVV
jgi:hypothetical protein